MPAFAGMTKKVRIQGVEFAALAARLQSRIESSFTVCAICSESVAKFKYRLRRTPPDLPDPPAPNEPHARARAGQKAIRTKPLSSLDSRSGKQVIAGGKSGSAMVSDISEGIVANAGII
jgi:hypothetical protein